MRIRSLSSALVSALAAVLAGAAALVCYHHLHQLQSNGIATIRGALMDPVLLAGGMAGALAIGLGPLLTLRHDLNHRRAIESLRQLNGALDHAVEGIACLDSDGKFVSVNAVYGRCTGYEPSEMLGRHWSLTVPPRDREAIRQTFEQTSQCGHAAIEALGCRKDSSVFHQNMVIVALRDMGGELLGHYQFIKDITQRKLADASHRTSEARFIALADNAPIGIFQCDLESRCSYVNGHWTKLTGLSAEHAEKTGWLGALHADDRRTLSTLWQRPTAARKQWHADVRFLRTDGKEIRVSCSASPMCDEAGTVQGYIGTITDVTAIKESEETLLRQAEDLRRSNRELEQFAYVASHDLQEPLRMVANYTQLIERRYRGKLGPEADEYINYAVEGARRMRSLIDDVLDFARVTRDTRPHEPTPMESMLTAALTDLATSIREKNAVVTHDPLPVITGNASQLRQVLQNLIGNAIKFCSRQPRIHIGVRPQSGGWIISIRDNGIGIDPDHLGKIFQVFQRLHSNSEYPGNGIGLAVCKRIVERHGGTIRAESHLNEGCTFTFTLPSVAAEMPSQEKLCA